MKNIRCQVLRYSLCFALFVILFSPILDEFVEARGPDEPCSYNKSNSYLKISNEPWTCKKVNYWVPEKCGIIEGLYKTDPACQAPTGPTDKELQDQREQREREQREINHQGGVELRN